MRLQHRRVILRQAILPEFWEEITDDESDELISEQGPYRSSQENLCPHASTLLLISVSLYTLASIASSGGTNAVTQIYTRHFNLEENIVRSNNRDANGHSSGRQMASAHISYNRPIKPRTTSREKTRPFSKGKAKRIMASTTDLKSSTVKKMSSVQLIKEKTSEEDTSSSIDSGFKDTWDRLDKAEDVPVFWHIPKAGGSAIKDILGSCHAMVLASDVGGKHRIKSSTEVGIVKVGEKGQYVNADTSTKQGILQAKERKLVESNLAEVIISPLFHETNSLFADSNTKKGRVFTIFRDPIERAVSMFHYLQYAEWEPTYTPQLRNMTLEEYATSEFAENNFVTRKLSNILDGPLEEVHVKAALYIVRTKILVGLMSDMEFSLDRFEKFFEWRFDTYNQEKCREGHVKSGGNRNTKKESIAPSKGSPAYKLLEIQNQYDLRIYRYAVNLFNEQEEFVIYKPNDFRLSST